MFIICIDRYFVHKNNKIILFESIEKANWFVIKFLTYVSLREKATNPILNIFGASPLVEQLKQQIQIIPFNFETIDKNNLIHFSEIEKK